jgi:hypothetical protein
MDSGFSIPDKEFSEIQAAIVTPESIGHLKYIFIGWT